MITVIPHIHTDPQQLEATLTATNGPLAFLGDFIDGGGGHATTPCSSPPNIAVDRLDP